MERSRSRSVRWTLIGALLLLPLATAPASAQNVGRAVVGGGLGVLGGLGITLATVVARAHFQDEYLLEPGDLIHWQSGAMIAAPAVGVVFGLHSGAAFEGSVVGGLSGLAVGTAVGVTVGALVTGEREGRWAGGAIGGGFGIALGGLVGGALGWRRHEKEGEAPLRVELSIPIGSRDR